MARTYTGAAADGVILVSIPKSGTHMLAAVIGDFGYTVKGVVGVRPSNTERTSGGYWVQRLGLLPELCNSDGYWWLERINAPSSWKSCPPPWKNKQCLALHELFLDRIDGEIYRRWESTGEPKIIFNYRDPRACLTSYVHWLCEGERMVQSPIQLACRAILSQFEFPDALMYAIRDPNFPGKRHFTQLLWLLDHPRVLRTRYEDLVGPCGGGENPKKTLVKIGDHLRSTSGLETRPYSNKSLTFRAGTIDGWRDDWTDTHHEAYERLHPGLLERWGYE